LPPASEVRFVRPHGERAQQSDQRGRGGEQAKRGITGLQVMQEGGSETWKNCNISCKGGSKRLRSKKQARPHPRIQTSAWDVGGGGVKKRNFGRREKTTKCSLQQNASWFKGKGRPLRSVCNKVSVGSNRGSKQNHPPAGGGEQREVESKARKKKIREDRAKKVSE